MIYTLTLNPAIDFLCFSEKIKRGNIYSSNSENIVVGGKGINVSFCLKELGVDSVATGFLAGFTGEKIKEDLSKADIKNDFVFLREGFSRINIKLRDGNETDINGKGPDISDDDLKVLLKKLKNIQNGDTLVLSGSIPPSLNKNIYALIIEKLQGKNIKFVVDAAGEALKATLKLKPFLIKPNKQELEELFGKKIKTKKQIINCAKALKNEGAQNVIVSLAEKGAVLLSENNKEIFAPAKKGKVINTVGAGDAMVAGFLAGYQKTNDFDYSLKLAIAAGSATAFSVGIAKKEDIDSIKI